MSSELVSAARAALRAANGLGSSVTEHVWAQLAGKAPRLRWLAPRRWETSGHERVLWVAPHPDDEVMGGAGSMIRHARVGDTVTIVTLTDGARSRAFGLDADAMATLREQEARVAAKRLGAGLRWAGLREGAWLETAGRDARAALADALAEVQPTVIYAPSAIDFHPEHQRVARTLAAALSESGSHAELRIYSSQVPLTPILVNLVHDVSDLEGPIRDALGAYASQRESASRTLRLRRYAGRFYGAAYGARAQVEGFCAVTAASFIELHRRPAAAFHAVSARAWLDPLALTIGTRERLAWRRLAGAGLQSFTNSTKV